MSRHCLRAVVILIALGLSTAFAASAAAMLLPTTRSAAPSRGAVKLGATDLKKVGGVQCGRSAGKWRAGALISSGPQRGWFVAWSTVAANNRADASGVKGAKRKALLKSAAAATAKDKSLSPKCAGAAGSTASAAAPAAGGPPLPTALRLSFANTAGVLRYETGRRAPLRRPRQAGLTNLDAVLRNGSLRNPVLSGSLVAAYTAIGPDGDLYFETGPSGILATPLPDGTIPTNCFIVRYDTADGSTTCVKTSPSDYGVWTSPYAGAPLQIGPNGEVYYLTSRSTIVLMRSYQGVVTSMTNPNISVSGFAAASNGAVLITGRTPSSNTDWTRVIHPDGSLTTLGSVLSWSLDTYPDGRIYWGGQTPGGAHAYDPATDSDQVWGGGYSGYKTSATTTDGKVFVTGSAYNTSTLFAQNYPTPGLASKGSIDLVTAISAAGTRIAIAGTQLSGRSRLGLYDPASNTTTLIDGGLTEMEYYNLSYSPTRNVVIFDALRFQDNAYVIGEIDLATDSISIISTAPTKLSGLTGY